MKLDFHYFGTYAAARQAGYNNLQALEIARAAEYVDDFQPSHLDGLTGVKVPSTTQTKPEMAKHAAMSILKRLFASKEKYVEYYNSVNAIWVPFHFLPGLDAEYYRGLGVADGMTDAELNLLTRPNGKLVPFLIAFCNNSRGSLQRLGLCMHVIADTWAHQDFAGIRSEKLNNAADNVTNRQGQKISVGMYSPGYRSFTPDLSCLGHGRMGDAPDWPDTYFNYYPRWKSRNFTAIHTHNNTESFYEAYRFMVKYMHYIRTQELLDEGTIRNDRVRQILETGGKEQSEAWKVYIREIWQVDILDFSVGYFKTDGAARGENSELFKFVDEFRIYFTYVYDLLSERGVTIDLTPMRD